MSVWPSIADVLETAVRIERQGIDFYSRLHDQSEAAKAGEVFRVPAAR